KGGGPLIPFVLSETAEGREKRRFVTDLLEEGVAEARQFVTESAGETLRYAVAVDGYVTVEGRRWDAVIVEIGERHMAHGHALAQRYRPRTSRKEMETAGNPAYLGEVPN